jgi:hypothetical protein
VDPFSSIGSTMMTLINLGAGLSHYEYSMTCRNGYMLSSALCTIYYLLYLATVLLLLMNLLTGGRGRSMCGVVQDDRLACTLERQNHPRILTRSTIRCACRATTQPQPPPAMIITTWHANQVTAVSHWKHRWALYVLKAERRLPPSWAQRLRLGQPAWDANAQCTVYRWVVVRVWQCGWGKLCAPAAEGSCVDGCLRLPASPACFRVPPLCSHVFETVDEDRPLDAGGKAGLDGQIRAMETTLDELRRKRGGGA